MRLFATFFCAFSLLLAASHSASANNKYAGLVVDADTGEVLYQENAGAKRYPASLTKMMTVYMMFDGMRQGKLKKNTRMKVSEKAASQPQTNIGLKEGETITVDQAIRALVVRSANDVAVVVGEHLAGSEWRFAMQMTNKARQLGMRHTVFKNAHGLPNTKQVTTAKDMAKLGMALRRDFPQYYDYFKHTQFSWKGKRYKSHNNVLKEYKGVDGIKTGYINASGFNLVTSAKKHGYNVVAVVLGGKTSKRRDQHMKDLLDRSFTKLAARGDRPRAYAKAPIPQTKPVKQIQVASARPTTSESTKLPFKRPTPKPSAIETEKAVTVASLGDNVIRFIPSSKPSIAKVSTESPFQKTTRKPTSAKSGWAIQVGAFKGKQNAMQAASDAIKRARSELADARIAISGKGTLHRAQLANLTKREAQEACQTLRQFDSQCFTFQIGSL